MKIVAISDQHGQLPEVPPCDLLLIAGDICPVKNHSIPAQEAFLAGPFARWLETVPARHIVGIAGNHDFIFQESPERLPRSLRWTYLQDSATDIEGMKIYGTPWQPWFYDWAFNAREPELEQRWQSIPLGTDILICHGPPRGYGDRNMQGQHTGSPSLLERIRVVRPKLTVFGHIHEGHGRYDVEGLLLANVSSLDERYRFVHAPTEFDVDL